MPPLSQYQARRLLDIISSNRSRVHRADHVDRDLWARAHPPLRGLIFQDKHQARANLVAGDLCAIPIHDPVHISPSPPLSPSASSASLSSASPMPQQRPVSPLLDDVPCAPIDDIPCTPPAPAIPRISSANSRASKISSAPSFGKMLDPLSVNSIHPDSIPFSSSSRSTPASTLSRHDRRSSPHCEEFGNEALITSIDDDINDHDLDHDYHLHHFQQHHHVPLEDPASPFSSTIPTVDQSSRLSKSHPFDPHSHDHSLSQPLLSSKSSSTNTSDATESIFTSPVIPTDSDYNPSAPSDALRGTFSESDLPFPHSLSSVVPTYGSVDADGFSCPPHPSHVPLPVTSHRPSRSHCHSDLTPSSTLTAPPPPPPLSSNNSYPHLRPSIRNYSSSTFPMDSVAPPLVSSASFTTQGIPLPPVSPPLAPSPTQQSSSFGDPDRSLSYLPSGPPSGPPSATASSQLEESSPVTDVGATISGHSTIAPDRSERVALSTHSSHLKNSHFTTSRSFVSTSDYFSQSGFTGCSDNSRRVDSSVEVETSDDGSAGIQDELDDDELREAELRSSGVAAISAAAERDAREKLMKLQTPSKTAVTVNISTY